MAQRDPVVSRRDFVRASSAALAAGALAGSTLSRGADGAPPEPLAAPGTPHVGKLRIAVIGCGGRGTGAVSNALDASEDTELFAMADVFPDRLATARGELSGAYGARGSIPDERCFGGFDAFRQAIASEAEIVILATPPHFRPIHLAEAVRAGKHVFMEKPVAVDPAGVRSVLESARIADEKGLSIVAGTQRRHEASYLGAMERLRAGELGTIHSARCYWNQGGLWKKDREPAWSDMEWQLRNWLYFTWLSGDHIVEQHVHNLDVINWALGAHPVRASGMGGRQVRTDPAYGHVFDHFAIEYEYPGGVTLLSQCRQIDGCAGRVEEVIAGSGGTLVTAPGRAEIAGAKPWRFKGLNADPYTMEHVALVRAITSGARVNGAREIAESTLTAIMGRMAAYTGKAITWEQALNSKLDLAPAIYDLGATIPIPAVAMPGRTPML